VRLIPRRWNAETWICSLRGHCVPIAGARRVRADDAALGLELPDGRRFGRCVRCDAWLPVDRGGEVAYDVVPPLTDLALPRRGDTLRDAIVLRLIAIERGLHSIAFGLLAIVLALLDARLDALHHSAQSIRDQLDSLASQSGRGGSRTFLDSSVARVLGLHHTTITVLAITATVYAIVEGVEAVGLWLERRWAEYLTVIATAGFLPFEVHELVERVTVLRLGAFVVNIALVIWLLWDKRLFGIRGGPDAREPFDWDAALAHPEAPVLSAIDWAGVSGTSRERSERATSPAFDGVTERRAKRARP
jgi:uncharacterized membrane protein (DUF2068 family)